jgi:hypothetical protein
LVQQFPCFSDEYCHGIRFGDDGGRPRGQGLLLDKRVTMSRENNHRHGWHEFLENPCFLQAIHKRRGKVGHNQGGAEQLCFFDGILTVFTGVLELNPQRLPFLQRSVKQLDKRLCRLLTNPVVNRRAGND